MGLLPWYYVMSSVRMIVQLRGVTFESNMPVGILVDLSSSDITDHSLSVLTISSVLSAKYFILSTGR